MKNIFITIFCFLFAISSIRILFNYTEIQDSGVLPDSNSEIPYDENGNKLSFYEYYQVRLSMNKEEHGYLTLEGLLECVEDFRHYEFRSLVNLQKANDTLKYFNSVTNFDAKEQYDGSNFFVDIWASINNFFILIFRNIYTICTITVMFTLSLTPILLDLIDLVMIVMDMVANLFGVVFGSA